jgi:hypothetical protein
LISFPVFLVINVFPYDLGYHLEAGQFVFFGEQDGDFQFRTDRHVFTGKNEKAFLTSIDGYPSKYIGGAHHPILERQVQKEPGILSLIFISRLSLSILHQITGFFTKIEISITNRSVTIEIAKPDAVAYAEAFGIPIKSAMFLECHLNHLSSDELRCPKKKGPCQHRPRARKIPFASATRLSRAFGTRGFPSHDYSWFGFIGNLP